MTDTRTPILDEAWQEAEAALPKGWPWHVTVSGPHGNDERYYLARGTSWTDTSGASGTEFGIGGERARATGPTPAAALQALAAALRGAER